MQALGCPYYLKTTEPGKRNTKKRPGAYERLRAFKLPDRNIFCNLFCNFDRDAAGSIDPNIKVVFQVNKRKCDFSIFHCANSFISIDSDILKAVRIFGINL